MKKTRRFGDYVYDLRKVCSKRHDANRLARAIRDSGKKSRIVQTKEGYGVYAK